MFSHSLLNKPFLAAHSRIPLRVMASSTNGVAGTSKGHEQANTLLEKAQDLGQKVAGAAGATVDKTVRPAPCTQCCDKMRYDAWACTRHVDVDGLLWENTSYGSVSNKRCAARG